MAVGSIAAEHLHHTQADQLAVGFGQAGSPIVKLELKMRLSRPQKRPPQEIMAEDRAVQVHRTEDSIPTISQPV